ncbi:hypothetical protein Q8A67_022266 [Cirrhinus molitorella]|uniref:Uncharacterized protein n=1 Tax=Cirrhinus molitorella TaxID=172907 RepID=A0AA88P965_9TELE|nr:hypothetical protein Q8A67_022266 [Cirrhinus molitorella]
MRYSTNRFHQRTSQSIFTNTACHQQLRFFGESASTQSEAVVCIAGTKMLVLVLHLTLKLCGLQPDVLDKSWSKVIIFFVTWISSTKTSVLKEVSRHPHHFDGKVHAV